MKNVLFVSAWMLVLSGIVLAAVALGLVAGAAAVLGFLGGVCIAMGIAGLIAMNSQETPEVPDAEVP